MTTPQNAVMPPLPEPIGEIVGKRPDGEFFGYFAEGYETQLKQRVYSAEQMDALLERAVAAEQSLASLRTEHAVDRRTIDACGPFMKDGETPVACIVRNRKDCDTAMAQWAKWKSAHEAATMEGTTVILDRVPPRLAALAAESELTRLRAENEALRADARRYRWLRDKHFEADDGTHSIAFMCDFEHWNDLDAAIDSARKGETGEATR